ncbi:MAG TPA: hypothetical protein VGG74_05460 [Kofleriaceae bacterium]|jgi:phage I-like protein
MQLVILLFIWALSLFISYQLIASGVRAGVSAIVVEAREQNDLLRAQNSWFERIAKQLGVPELPVKSGPRAQVAASPQLAGTADDPEAIAALKRAQEAHFSKRFAQAVEGYREVVSRFPNTKQAVAAQAQIENLRGVM